MITHPVAELFGPTIQGEGGVAGMRCMFVRFGGCDSRCSWCDSMHAVDPANKANWRPMSYYEIFSELMEKAGTCRTVVLSGGNPVIHDIESFVTMLDSWEWRVWVETQGTIFRRWLDLCNVTVSPKPPSAYTYDRGKLRDFLNLRFAGKWSAGLRTVMKIPVDLDNEEDISFAQDVFTEFAGMRGLEFALSVVTYPTDTGLDLIDRWRKLADHVGEWPVDLYLLPQLHVLLWGHEKGR